MALNMWLSIEHTFGLHDSTRYLVEVETDSH